MHAKLTVLSGRMQGAEVTLRDGEITIGRSADDDLVLPDEVVSRLQASLHFEDGRYLLRDESSTNGTFINDRRIVEQVLRDGDVIEFGLDGPSARFESLPPADEATIPGSTATPITAPRPDDDEPPDAWIDRGVAYSSTGIFKVPEASVEPDPTPGNTARGSGRSAGLRVWATMLGVVIVLAALVVLALLLI